MLLRILLFVGFVVAAINAIFRVFRVSLSTDKPGQPRGRPTKRKDPPLDRSGIQDAEYRDVEG